MSLNGRLEHRLVTLRRPMPNTLSLLGKASSRLPAARLEQAPLTARTVRRCVTHVWWWIGSLAPVAVTVLSVWLFARADRLLDIHFPEVRSISILNTVADQTPVEVTISATSNPFSRKRWAHEVRSLRHAQV